jgi:putative transposase
MKYAFIAKNRHWPLAVVCALLNVSPSGYHEYRKRCNQCRQPHLPESRNLSNAALLIHIKAIHTEVKQEYGWPRMHKALQDRSIRVGKERVRKLMQLHGIQARHKRKWITTTDSKHHLPVAPNLLNREFSVSRPNQVWTTDITYIAVGQSWQYLVAFIDLFSRQIVGWSMQNHMRTEMVVDALRMAYFRRHPVKGLIVHSDRGSQYCSNLFQDTLTAYGMQSSMSRKGNCWDNAPTESLWGKLKVARIHGRTFDTARAAKDEVLDWINFYNTKRLHSTLNYVSPMTYERNWSAEQAA